MYFQQQQANAPAAHTWGTPAQPQRAAQPVRPEDMHTMMNNVQNMTIEQRTQIMNAMGMLSNQQGNGASSAASATMPPLAGQEPAHVD